MGNENLLPFREAALPVSVPWNRAIGRVGPEADPLLTGAAQYAIRLELSDIRVGAEVLNALFLRTLRATLLQRRVARVICRVARAISGCTSRGERVDSWVRCKY